MPRQTDLTAEELIEICQPQIQGDTACDCCCHDRPICFYLNEIGQVALSDGNRQAQKFLIGLLRHANDEWRFIAFFYLLQISDDALEPGDAIALSAQKKTPENTPLVRMALSRIYRQN